MSTSPHGTWPASFRWGALAAGLLLLLVGPGCEELLAEVAADVKESYGVDVNSPTDVGLAAAGASTLGNEEVAGGLDVMRAARREDHTVKGNRCTDRGDWACAQSEYEEALRWAPTDSEAQRTKVVELHRDLGYTHIKEAEENTGRGRSDLARQGYRRAAQEYERAAQGLAETEAFSARAHRRAAADYYYRAGDRRSACAALDEAGDPGGRREQYRCPPRS